ncbi:MAG: response regulator [Opitutaceae bacterium]
MNLVKKVLIAHSDPKLKRKLVLLLADAGYDVRAHVNPEESLETARKEWFDLALVGELLTGMTGLQLAEELKRVQPTVPIALLAEQPELALVVKGIRLGLADVLPLGEDLRPLIQRIAELLNPGRPPSLPDPTPAPVAVTAADLAEVETALARLGSSPVKEIEAKPAVTLGDVHEELLRSTRERTELEAKVQRLQHEKAALEAELRMLLTQNSDAAALQQELADLRSQQEMTAAAQAAIDAKAQALSEQREEIAEERSALEIARRRVSEAHPTLPEWAISAEEVAAMRERVQAEADRQRQAAMELQREAAQIARERRRWHDDLDLLREQETNLREYEARLRKVQAQLEADRVLWFSTTARPEAHSPFEDSSLREAWQKLQRASELLETERNHVRDDRLFSKEQELALQRREQNLAAREARLLELERRHALQLAQQPTAAPASSTGNSMRSLARAPLEMAKSVFGSVKK